MAIVDIPTFSLSNNVAIPAIGLGTYPIASDRIPEVLHDAQEVGYTLYDTSASYGNERGIGKALRSNDFVTTKISNVDQKRGTVGIAQVRSRLRLRRKTIDLLLLHWPYPGKYCESWKVLEKLYKKGICRAIGVANFKVHHLKTLMESAEILPMVDQFERHPMYAEADLVTFCKDNGIVPEAYTPFARMDKRLFGDLRLKEIAARHDKQITQVILRWNYQHGVISIPKTESRQRMIENASVFDFTLSEQEMRSIDELDCGMRVRYDPDNCDYDKL